MNTAAGATRPEDPGARLIDDASRVLASAAMALARRFANSGTLWCWSPHWPEHAQHVAVEFVHPVIMGTRALPATAVEAADPVGALRILVSAGDVLLVVAPADDPVVLDVMSRAPAWGVETIWIGSGPRPAASAADHQVWFNDAPTAMYDGAFVLAYHVLWELTHVCFEHPGLLKDPAPGCDDGHCITCSDEGRLGEVISPCQSGAQVRTASGPEEIDTTLVGEVSPGDLVLIHAGVAIARLEGGDR